MSSHQQIRRSLGRPRIAPCHRRFPGYTFISGDGRQRCAPLDALPLSPCVTISIFVVNPLGTSCGWGSSRPVALLSTPPEARCAARLDVFLGGEVLIRGAGAFLLVCRGAVSIGAAEGGDRLEGTGYGGRRQRLWTRVGPVRSPQLQRPLGEPSVRARGPPAVSNKVSVGKTGCHFYVEAAGVLSAAAECN
ncbi:unnamed protein product [Pleuronectes platessa]|uniref:Uncharacterized protein n=1 Tax=Pleuronectes platessa TaxID=8262 RepID=A0A9N7Z8Y4_PLEPL|nr:unnamed protein product [Pleuronectes platessa]